MSIINVVCPALWYTGRGMRNNTTEPIMGPCSCGEPLPAFANANTDHARAKYFIHLIHRLHVAMSPQANLFSAASRASLRLIFSAFWRPWYLGFLLFQLQRQISFLNPAVVFLHTKLRAFTAGPSRGSSPRWQCTGRSSRVRVGMAVQTAWAEPSVRRRRRLRLPSLSILLVASALMDPARACPTSSATNGLDGSVYTCSANDADGCAVTPGELHSLTGTFATPERTGSALAGAIQPVGD